MCINLISTIDVCFFAIVMRVLVCCFIPDSKDFLCINIIQFRSHSIYNILQTPTIKEQTWISMDIVAGYCILLKGAHLMSLFLNLSIIDVLPPPKPRNCYDNMHSHLIISLCWQR